jgi:anti-anti-sigma factor
LVTGGNGAGAPHNPKVAGSNPAPATSQGASITRALGVYRLTPTERPDATELLEIAVSESGGVRSLRLTGEFDLAGVNQFERLLTADQTTEAATFVLDMRGLTFIDSSGLRALIMADQRVRAEGGRFIVVRGPDRVNAVLEMTGVAQRIELVDYPPAG